jgi:hypothetical protein
MLRIFVCAAIWWSRRIRTPKLRWLPLRIVATVYAVYFWLTH